MQRTLSNPDVEPELRHSYEEIEKVNLAVEELVRDLTDAELSWKPRPDAWSIAQCLEHLTVTARADLPNIRRAIAEARSQSMFGHGPFRYGLFGSLLVKAMGPSARLKFSSPAIYRPGTDTPPGDVIREFFLTQQEISNCILEANGLDLARTKVSLPSHSYLRLSIGQEFRLVVVHEQRHVLQAQRIKLAATRR